MALEGNDLLARTFKTCINDDEEVRSTPHTTTIRAIYNFLYIYIFIKYFYHHYYFFKIGFKVC